MKIARVKKLKSADFITAKYLLKDFARIVFTVVVISLIAANCNAETYQLLSPDKKVKIDIATESYLTLKVYYQDEPLFQANSIAIEEVLPSIFNEFRVKKVKYGNIQSLLHPIVKTKSATVEEKCNYLTIFFKNFQLEVRAYNEGVAYRFISDKNQEIIIKNEKLTVDFPDNTQIYFPEEVSMLSHNERLYRTDSIQDIETDRFCSLPMLAVKNGVNVAITESSLYNYAGMWLKKTGRNTLSALFPKYPKTTQLVKDRTEKVIETEEFIAKTNAQRAFPWRIFAIAKTDAELLTNQLVWILSEECVLKATDWIKPGKVSWDWWNANNIYGVDFESGVNTKTYKYYIDFASKYGIEYVILDEGWYKLGNLMEIVPEIDMEEIMSYAKEKNVGIILWVVWKTLDNQLDEALAQFDKWGVKGIKVDFMQRDDQPMINYYEKIAVKAAEHKLLVDFHGSYKPSGLNRKYPNVMTSEGVRGLEHNKWANYITPDHDLTLPFIRMFAGPMDYTPGAMVNAAKGNHAILFNTPMSNGTRVHQMAMYVIYESPLQMLADNPSNYLREPEVMEFLSPVPSVWDETKILEAKITDYIISARRSGNQWYIGAMNDWQAKEFTISLDFLEKGKTFDMLIFNDGVNANRYGSDYVIKTIQVTSESKIPIKMASGGGWVARLVPRN